MPATPPRVLTIAGSDSGGGAGIQADLKTFAAHGVYGLSAITALTAQNTLAVTAIHDVPVAMVAAQLDAVFADIGVDAVKIGMLSSAELVATVGACLRRYRPPIVVLDPVMVAKSGAILLADDAVEALIAELLPLSTLVTPNLPEAAKLLGRPLDGEDPEALDAAAAALTGLGGGHLAVLLKGGHAPGPEIVDRLQADGQLRHFRHPRQATAATHGTGCTLSSAIAARLALGQSLAVAVEGAIDYLQGAIAAAYPLGGGHGPVDHLYRRLRAAEEA
jgi:hydroxymethylpyrimidine/phosphomethylpyrimidine kinase